MTYTSSYARIMALAFLPAEHIPSVFDALDDRANNEHLDAAMVYIYNTWSNSSVFTVECWSIFGKSITTNNDCEGWNNRLNTRLATRGPVPFYVLVLELYKRQRTTRYTSS
ncbi:hypothetical protein DPMN_081175 [Dreissena polymorpha]|uniref:MULE transposase domain-containing protein n=1 Tax=Dreissena polymorpha TaxID=45954 RepID=A0A9D3Y8E7_DREPO|nr:hypothetical protein DPMN_081175 [Dreissena polymorpha]